MINKARKQIREAMKIIEDIDLLYGLTISYRQREQSQKKLNKAYNILDNLDAELEREDIRIKQREGANEQRRTNPTVKRI